VRYLIERESRAHFESPVREHHVQLRLAPWDYEWQRVHSFSLTVDPAVEPASHLDGFGNLVHRFAVLTAHERLITRLRAEVETLLENPFDFEPVAPAREREWIELSLREAPRLWDFVVHRNAYTPLLPDAIADARVPALKPGVPLLRQVQETMGWIQDFCELDTECDEPQPDLASLFESRCGSAADFAHLLIAVLRGWQIPARYVIGYVDPGYFDPDDDEPGADAEPKPQTMRPWTEVLIPGAGWRGFDPSTGLLADATHIRVAVGRDAGDVLTERGVYKGDAHMPETQITLVVSRID
jgi:transglutaminase-like putative cysteine protease